MKRRYQLADTNNRNDVDLTEYADLIESVIQKECPDVEVSIEEKKRWVNFTRTICRICGRYFALDWQEWLADHQDNQYPDQPYEVAKHEYEKTMKVTEWKRI